MSWIAVSPPPQFFNYGIDELFKQGSQAYYCVKCPTCKDWSKLNYLSKVEIPGFAGNLETFDKDDLLNPQYKVNEAFMRCSCCDAPLPPKAFMDPNNRKWIHTFPDRAKDFSSRQIYPLDVPTVNPLQRTIKQLADYRRKKDWANFKLGEAYQDSETSFLEHLIRAHAFVLSVPKPTDMPTQTYSNCFFGLDVGKTCHLLVGVPNKESRDGVDVIYAERIRQTGSNHVLKRMKELNLTFKFVGGVVDSAPDITLAESITDWKPSKFWATRFGGLYQVVHRCRKSVFPGESGANRVHQHVSISDIGIGFVYLSPVILWDSLAALLRRAWGCRQGFRGQLVREDNSAPLRCARSFAGQNGIPSVDFSYCSLYCVGFHTNRRIDLGEKKALTSLTAFSSSSPVFILAVVTLKWNGINPPTSEAPAI